MIDLGHNINLESEVWFSQHATDIILDLDIIFPWQCTKPALHILSCCLLSVGPRVSVQCINCSGGCHKYFCLVKYICLTPAPPHFTHTLQFAKLTICFVTKVISNKHFSRFSCLLAIMFSFISSWGINDHQQFTHCTPWCVANFPSALSAKRKYARGGVKSYVRSAAINPHIPPTRRVSSGPSITPAADL